MGGTQPAYVTLHSIGTQAIGQFVYRSNFSDFMVLQSEIKKFNIGDFLILNFDEKTGNLQ